MKRGFDKKRLHEVYLEIWKERGPYSQVSGKYLGKEPNSLFFDHLLEKYKFPELIYDKNNIILCTVEEHDLRTKGFPLPKHQELIDKAWEQKRK